MSKTDELIKKANDSLKESQVANDVASEQINRASAYISIVKRRFPLVHQEILDEMDRTK